MASFARTLKPPAAYLSPRRRPTMPGRTLSNSSELSLTSSPGAQHAEDARDQYFTSNPNSPAMSPALGHGQEGMVRSTEGSPDDQHGKSFRPHSGSQPIAIKVPRIKAHNPVGTPPEPLSARGDHEGGYFPLHEDPNGRVHRPHPFLNDTGLPRQGNSDTIAMQADRVRSTHLAARSVATHANTPVSSYITSGFQDAPLSMGKYYPSNYEQWHQQPESSTHLHPESTGVAEPSATADSNIAQRLSAPIQGEVPQSEKRRRMLQYQRDMVAQATMALGSSAKPAAVKSLRGLPVKDIWLAGASQNPLSPKLHPLGSPGPVTPMELEGEDGGYPGIGKKPRNATL